MSKGTPVTPPAAVVDTTIAAGSPASCEARRTLSEGQFIQTHVSGLCSSAKSLYAKVEGYNAYTRWTLSTLDKSTGWISRPLLSKVTAIGNPVVEKLDNGLSVAYNGLDSTLYDSEGKVVSIHQAKDNVQKLLVESSWFKRVDNVLRERCLPRVASFSSFVSAAEGTFRESSPRSFEEFKEALKTRLSGWDEAFLAPSKVFYANAVEKLSKATASASGQVDRVAVLSSVKDGLRNTWDHYVVDTSLALYNVSVAYYAASKENAAFAGQTTKEFIDAIKERLGARWSESLAAPLAELYANAKTATLEDLQPLRDSHSIDGVVGSSKNVANRVQSIAQKGWIGTLQLSQKTLDYVLPEDATSSSTPQLEGEGGAVVEAADAGKEGEPTPSASTLTCSENLTLLTLGATATSRLRKRASRAWTTARDVSAKVVKPVSVPADVVDFAESAVRRAQSVIERLEAIASPVASGLKKRLETARDASVEALNQLKSVLASKKDLFPSQVSELSSSVLAISKQLLTAVKQNNILDLPFQSLSFVKQTLGYETKSEHYNEFAALANKVATASFALISLTTEAKKTVLAEQQVDEGASDDSDNALVAPPESESAGPATADKSGVSDENDAVEQPVEAKTPEVKKSVSKSNLVRGDMPNTNNDPVPVIKAQLGLDDHEDEEAHVAAPKENVEPSKTTKTSSHKKKGKKNKH